MARKKKTDLDIATPIDEEGRQKALDTALKDLTKRFGDGSVMRLGEAQNMQVDTVPTGSLGVDIAIGAGGVPFGRITEIFGPESSGKTTLCLHIIAESQKRGGICAFIDMEHALDPRYAALIGVDIDNLIVSQPDTGEQALEITEALVRSGAMNVVVLDSVAALVPRAEIEGEMGDSHVGLQARLMSQALRKLAGAVKQANVALIFTNQIREKVGVMFGCFQYDAPVWLADGRTLAIGELVTQRLDVEVMSFNTETQQFEARRIVNWFDNGVTEQFLRFSVASYAGTSRTFDCTANHLLLTPEGYVPAGALRAGAKLISAMPQLVPAGIAPQPTYSPQAMAIQAIDPAPPADDMRRFDIEVAGNHCYLVDGVVVHNSPETQPGGRALKFYASVRLDIRRIQSIKASGDNVGNRTRVKVKKNKIAPPFKEAEFDIMFNEGISKTGEILDIGTELGLVEKRGAFFRYNDELLGQGRENAKVFLSENPAMADAIENGIRQHFGLPSLSTLPDEDE